MVHVWVVIGGPNVGKTSTVRCLTGVRRKTSDWNVAYNQFGIQLTYVFPGAAQEYGNQRYNPTDIVDLVKQSQREFVILTLRYNGVGTYPNAGTYLNTFQKAKWAIEGYAILAQYIPAKPLALPPPLRPLPNNNWILIPPGTGQHCLRRPCNEIAAIIRTPWGIA